VRPIVGPKLESMHGIDEQAGYAGVMIVSNSSRIGNRQSQCPAKQSLFSDAKKSVNAVPSASVTSPSPLVDHE
jgi:hypothetical protein